MHGRFLPQVAGRWSALPVPTATATERAVGTAEVLLERYGVVTRGSVMNEGVPGGFALAYTVLSVFEESARARVTAICRTHPNLSPVIVGEPEAQHIEDTVNAIAPGFFPSRMTRSTLQAMGDTLVSHAPLVLQIVMAAAMIWCVMQVKSSDIQPFIYFQF